MRTLLTTILFLITVTGFSQDYYINLDWPKYNVRAQNRNLELIYSCPDYLEYKIPGGFIAYEFTDRVCTSSFICLDSLAGIRLVESHINKNWASIGLDKWLYYAGYDSPVLVEADWYGMNVIFIYTLKVCENTIIEATTKIDNH